jgi:hypothetical protein
MANEISVSATLKASKGGAAFAHSKSYNITMSGDDMFSKTQIIGTSAEALDMGEITGVPAAIMVQNLDGTNFVVLSLVNDGSTPFAKLLKGQAAIFPPATATIYALADTASVRVLVSAVEA